jgi:hypothetical protein
MSVSFAIATESEPVRPVASPFPLSANTILDAAALKTYRIQGVPTECQVALDLKKEPLRNI